MVSSCRLGDATEQLSCSVGQTLGGESMETGGANVGAHMFFGAGAPGGPKRGTPISAPNLVTVLGTPMVLRYTYFRKPTGRGVQCHVSAENTKKGSRMYSRAFPSALLRVLWQDY